jgi:hypothetical protein
LAKNYRFSPGAVRDTGLELSAILSPLAAFAHQIGISVDTHSPDSEKSQNEALALVLQSFETITEDDAIRR